MPRPVRNFLSSLRDKNGDHPDGSETFDDKDDDTKDSKSKDSAGSKQKKSRVKDFSTHFVKSDKSWNVKMPPVKKHVIRGRLVPTLRRFLREKPRRIAIEVRSPIVGGEITQSTEGGEEEAIDVGKEIDADTTLKDRDTVYIQVFRPTSGAPSDSESDDEASVASADLESCDWAPHAIFKMDDVTVIKRQRNIVEVSMGSGSSLVVRDIRFATPNDATSFEETLQLLQEKVKERAQGQIALYKEKRNNSPSKAVSKSAAEGDLEKKPHGDPDQINLLIEIVSASNLPVADMYSTDAYVLVTSGSKELHRTSTVKKNISPIWTFATGSLFLIETHLDDASSSLAGGLTFTVKDYDAIGFNDELGQVVVGLDELLDGDGERIGYDLLSVKPSSKTHKTSGKLYLRYKAATASDVEFMTAAKDYNSKVGVYLPETYVPVDARKKKLLKAQQKKGRNGVDLLRVKPYPDPDREEDTKWMSENDIESEAWKDSTFWTEAGSGDHGRVYIELIGCDGLPNLDRGSIDSRNKTDTFACIVFEDAAVNSDIINDSLAPRWMPWCRRAFAFRISNPSSDIFIGAFDYDSESRPGSMLTTAKSIHDRIGRARINLSQFLPNTLYTLKYNLLHDELSEKSRGTVMLRLRIDLDSPRNSVIAGLSLPTQPTYFSVARKVDFHVINYTIEGRHVKDSFSMQVLLSYLAELQSYEFITDIVLDAVLVVVLWRGHYEWKIGERALMLPIHSVIAFTWGILVTWNFNLYPSFLCFCVAWMMLACKEYASSCPSRWHRTPSYLSILRMLLLNTASGEKVESVDKNPALTAFYDNKAALMEKRKLAKQQDREAKEAMEKEFRDEIETAAEEDVTITSLGTSGLQNVATALNPLALLSPVQKGLGQLLSCVRICKTILLWEESFAAFWIVTMSLLISALFLFVPWGFILRWLLRIAVWVLLGPWMCLVDKYVIQAASSVDGDVDSQETREQRLRARYLEIMTSATNSRIRRERALKLKAMKRFYFGKYLMAVPILNGDNTWHCPLEQSSAVPFEGETPPMAEKKYGQHLTGDMVMAREIQIMDIKEKQLPSRRPRLFKKIFRRFRKTTEHPETTPLLPKEKKESEIGDYESLPKSESN